MRLIELDQVLAATDGVFTPAMLAPVGVTIADIGRLRRIGRIRRVCGHAYIRGDRTPTLIERSIGALLTWPESVVCFRTAGLIHGFPVSDGGTTDVLVPNGRRPMAGLRTWQWGIGPTAVEHHGAWVVTDFRTTVADCLGRLPEAEAWGLLAWLRTRDVIMPADVDAQLAERRNLYGVVRLRRMAAAVRRGAVSPAEVELHDFLKRHGFTGWSGDAKIFRQGRVVARADILFHRERVIVEFDGVLAHRDRQARDAARDRLLRSLGYTVVHVTWRRLMGEPRSFLTELRSALAGVATTA